LDAVAEVGPAAILRLRYTMARYRTAFYTRWCRTGALRPVIRRRLPHCDERGEPNLAAPSPANQPPERDPAIIEALDAFVARRTARCGAPPVI